MTKGKPWVYASAWGATLPTTESAQQNGGFVRAMGFFINTPGRIMGIRFASKTSFPFSGFVFLIGGGGTNSQRTGSVVCGTAYTSSHIGTMGWNNLYLKRPLPVVANATVYCHMIHAGTWRWCSTPTILNTQSIGSGEVIVPMIGTHGATTTISGVGDATAPLLPRNTMNGDALGVDLLFLSNTQAGV